MKTPFRFPTLLLALSATALMAESPWDGTWKLNTGKGQFTGETWTYSKAPGGKIHFSNGTDYQFDFATDGKPYTRPNGVVVTWKETGKGTWESEAVVNGFRTDKVLRTLSPDGKTLTAEITEFRPDGTTAHSTEVNERTSGGPGLLGSWKNIKAEATSATFIISTPAPGRMDFENTAYKFKASGTTDGTPFPLTGPTFTQGWTERLLMPDPRTLTYDVLQNGKLMGKGTMVLSEDGLTITATDWTPGKESEKTVAIWEK
jgi:hypothetical protein